MAATISPTLKGKLNKLNPRLTSLQQAARQDLSIVENPQYLLQSSTDGDWKGIRGTSEPQLHCSNLDDSNSLAIKEAIVADLRSVGIEIVDVDSLQVGHADNPGQNGRSGSDKECGHTDLQTMQADTLNLAHTEFLQTISIPI